MVDISLNGVSRPGQDFDQISFADGIRIPRAPRIRQISIDTALRELLEEPAQEFPGTLRADDAVFAGAYPFQIVIDGNRHPVIAVRWLYVQPRNHQQGAVPKGPRTRRFIGIAAERCVQLAAGDRLLKCRCFFQACGNTFDSCPFALRELSQILLILFSRSHFEILSFMGTYTDSAEALCSCSPPHQGSRH